MSPAESSRRGAMHACGLRPRGRSRALMLRGSVLRRRSMNSCAGRERPADDVRPSHGNTYKTRREFGVMDSWIRWLLPKPTTESTQTPRRRRIGRASVRSAASPRDGSSRMHTPPSTTSIASTAGSIESAGAVRPCFARWRAPASIHGFDPSHAQMPTVIGYRFRVECEFHSSTRISSGVS